MLRQNARTFTRITRIRHIIAGSFIILMATGFEWDESKFVDHTPTTGFPVYDLQRNAFDLDEEQTAIVNLVNNWEKAFLNEQFAELEKFFSLPFYADKRIASNLTGFRMITRSWFDRKTALNQRIEGEDKPVEMMVSRIDKTANTGLESEISAFLGPLQMTSRDYVVIIKYKTRETTLLIRRVYGAPKVVAVF